MGAAFLGGCWTKTTLLEPKTCCLWLNCGTLRAAMGACLEGEGWEPLAGKAQGSAAALGSSSLCLKCLFI